ncbi:MAG: NeuD/PglB/VioB family sugar acetyltransferase [Cyclobacteriaceae bacterium]|nr:NeuD/PglB/VioB family sugar acetyltransferase [Cyclobacteriaceae bacterium]
MKKKLLIVGAGNVGAYLAYNISDFPEFEIIGFLDDDDDKHNNSYNGYRVLGFTSEYKNYVCEGLSVVICIHSPQVKKMLYNKIKNSEVIFPNFVSPKAWISNGCKIGKGVIIYPGVSINYECIIGDFVNINMNCAIGHNVTIRAFSSLSPGVNLGGFTIVDESVDFGIGAVSIQNINVGAYSVIGGQSILIRDVAEGVKIAGIPAKEI